MTLRQLADVAGPAVALPAVRRRPEQSLQAEAILVAALPDKGFGEEPEILEALRKGGARSGTTFSGRTDPRERPVATVGVEVFVGRGQTRVSTWPFSAADADELPPAGRGAPWLRRERMSRRSASRKMVPSSAASNRPRFLGDRAGERPALVPEQLALDESGGMAAPVDLDERTLASAEASWMARAMSSLPLPLSPVS